MQTKIALLHAANLLSQSEDFEKTAAGIPGLGKALWETAKTYGSKANNWLGGAAESAGRFVSNGLTGRGIGTGFRQMRSALANPNNINYGRFTSGLTNMAGGLARTGATWGAGIYGLNKMLGSSEPQQPASMYYQAAPY